MSKAAQDKGVKARMRSTRRKQRKRDRPNHEESQALYEMIGRTKSV